MTAPGQHICTLCVLEDERDLGLRPVLGDEDERKVARVAAALAEEDATVGYRGESIWRGFDDRQHHDPWRVGSTNDDDRLERYASLEFTNPRIYATEEYGHRALNDWSMLGPRAPRNRGNWTDEAMMLLHWAHVRVVGPIRWVPVVGRGKT